MIPSRQITIALRIALMAGTIVAGTLPAAPASAAQYQCGAPGYYFSGWEAHTSGEPGKYEGAGSDLLYQFGALCVTDSSTNNSYASWTMIASGDFKGWAQSGLLYYPGLACTRHFSQQQQDASTQPYTVVGNCVSPGEVHHAWQQAVYVTGQWHMRSNIDSTIFNQSSWDPFSSWPAPFVPEYFGETHFDQSDVPGTATNKTEFGPDGHLRMQVQNFYDDNWYDTCGSVYLYSYSDARYQTDAPACDHVRSWTSG